MIAAFAALLATAAAAGTTPAAGAAARLKAAERTLAAIESSGCPAGVDPERAVRDAADGRLSPAAAHALDDARADVRLYFSCRAYAAGAPGPCAALSRTAVRVVYSVDKSALKRPDTLDFLCVSDLQDMRMARATIAGDRKAFVAACLAHDAAGHRDFLRGKVDESCEILAGGGEDPAGTCRKLGPLWSNPLPFGFCRGELAQFAGDEAHCRTIEGQPAARELCLGYSAWKAARRGDRAACASSPVCRALSGEGAAACAPLARRALAGACALDYAPAALDAAGRDLDEAEKLLAGAEGGAAPDAARARAADALSERVARARLRLERLRATAVPAASPAP